MRRRTCLDQLFYSRVREQSADILLMALCYNAKTKQDALPGLCILHRTIHVILKRNNMSFYLWKSNISIKKQGLWYPWYLF